MILQLFGVLTLLAAGAAFVMHMHTSFATQGGGLGQNPCVAAATIQVPLMTILGLTLLDNATGQLDLQWWQWLLIWLIETVFVAAATIWIGNIAYKKARKTPE
jgi:hypothetical protein